MPDNIPIESGTSPNVAIVRTDLIGANHYPVSKIALGGDGVDEGYVSTTRTLPVGDMGMPVNINRVVNKYCTNPLQPIPHKMNHNLAGSGIDATFFEYEVPGGQFLALNSVTLLMNSTGTVSYSNSADFGDYSFGTLPLVSGIYVYIIDDDDTTILYDFMDGSGIMDNLGFSHFGKQGGGYQPDDGWIHSTHDFREETGSVPVLTAGQKVRVIQGNSMSNQSVRMLSCKVKGLLFDADPR